jgi:U3 small nucleolar RNA-associated protein 22
MIPGRIVEYLLHRHLSIRSDEIKRYSSIQGWATILQVPDTARDAISTANSQKLGFRPILDGYQEFYKFLKSIDDDLPLSILNVTPASELLRYSSAFIPHPIDLDRNPSAAECVKYIPRAEIVLQFESSPRWPEDLAALQNVKMAILEKLGNLINSRLSGARAGIHRD